MTHTTVRDEMFDDGIDLGPYVAAAWRRKWMIAAFTIACTLAAFAWSWRTVPVYEASAQIAVLPSAIPDPAQVATLAAFRALPAKRGLAAQVARELHLEAPPIGIDAATFAATCVSVGPAGITESTLVTVRLPDGVAAANAANRIAAKAIDASAQLDVDDLRLLEQQVAQARDRFDEATAKLAEYERKAGALPEMLRTDGRRVIIDSYGRSDPVLNRLQFDYDVVRAMYGDVVLRYERVKVQAATRKHQFQVVEPAVPPAGPVAPHPVRAAVVGGLVAFVLSIGLVVIVQLIALSAKPPAFTKLS